MLSNTEFKGQLTQSEIHGFFFQGKKTELLLLMDSHVIF